MDNEYRVMLSGINITDWVITKPSIIYSKNRMGELSEIPNADILVDNKRHVFTPLHANSIIQDVREREVLIYENSLLIYKGYLRNSLNSTDDTTALLQCTASINKVIGATFIPISNPSLLTFAEISAYIYGLYNIEIDGYSYERSREKQEDLGLFGILNHTLDHLQKVMEIQQWLANAGICKHYFVSDKAYMEFVDPFETVYSMYTFTDDHIISIDNYNPIEKTEYDAYTVNTVVGTARKEGLVEISPLEATTINPVAMINIGGGYLWGDYQIELSKKRQDEITVRLVKTKEAFWLGLNSVFTIQSETEGIEANFILTSIDKSNDIYVVVTGESV